MHGVSAGILVKFVACSSTENDDVLVLYCVAVVAFARVTMAVEAPVVEYEVFAVEEPFVGEMIMKVGDDDGDGADDADAVVVAVAVVAVVAGIDENPSSFVARHHARIDMSSIPESPFHNSDS